MCSAMLALPVSAQDAAFLEIPLELPTEFSSDAKDFPRDNNRRIVEDAPLPKEQDHPLLRRQGQSLIPWKDVKETEFLSIRRWIAERAERDKDPLWKVKLRLNSSPEQVGKVISCVGTCIMHRGIVPNRVRWQSRILEGDEIKTEADSYLWLMLTDGALVRLSPETSIAFLEMNVAKDKFFFHARLNQGHLHWLPRSQYVPDSRGMVETDRLFLPLMEPTVNLEYFHRQLHAKLTESQKMLQESSLIITGQQEQFEATTNLVKENSSAFRSHVAMIVTPNATVMGRNVPMTFFYPPSGKMLFKQHAVEGDSENKAEMFYRGYTNTEKVQPLPDQWMETSEDGRSIVPLEVVPPLLSASEILFKRIPTLIYLREKWVAESTGLWKSLSSPQKLATDWGLRLWGNEIDARVEFLLEHTRRVETTNLRALARVVKNKPTEFDGRYFSKAMDKYFHDMKRRHSFSNSSLLDMTPLHFYGWVLINAKQL